MVVLALTATSASIGPRSAAGQATADSWRKLSDMPAPRWEAGTVVLDNRLYVLGGYLKGTKSTKRVDVFDPRDSQWRRLADLPSAVTHLNAVLDGRSIWLAGGFKDGYPGKAIQEVWKYDVDRNSYVAGPPLPEPRAGGELALVGRRLHYLGGLLPDRDTDSADHWTLDLDALANANENAKWKPAAALPSPRNQFAAVVLDGKIHVLGGQFGHDRGQDDQARVDVYDPATNSWNRGVDLPKPHSHAEGSTFIVAGQVFMMGGMTRQGPGKRRRIDNEMISFSSGGKWKTLGQLPRPLSSPAAAIIGDKLFVAGGSLDGANPQPGMWVRDASAWRAPSASADWPGLLGPKRDGCVRGFQPPSKWPKQLTKVWQVEVGTGYGSPLVVGDQVFQHARQDEDEVLWRLDLKTGDVKWRQSHAVPFKIGGGGEGHGKGPKSSPTFADGRVFTMSIAGVLSAWDAGSGKLLWNADYGTTFKKKHPYWGASTSPLVDGDRVIVHFGSDEEGALVALDVATGKEAWKVAGDGPSYSSPLVVEIQNVRQVVEWNHEALVGVERNSGRPLWRFPFPHVGSDQNMPTPVFHQGRVLLGGENRGIRSLEPQRTDGKWTVKERWAQKKVALNMSSAVMNGDLLYGFSHYERGQLICLDVESGEILWRSPGRTGENVAFLSIPGHVAALISGGELRIVAATGDRYQPVASYRVAESPTWAPPVLLKDGVLVKDRQSLTFWSLTEPTD
ncbi:MAG: PQQ-binding-like beta-propeller repeat protein [Planctomycetales bacterium]